MAIDCQHELNLIYWNMHIAKKRKEGL